MSQAFVPPCVSRPAVVGMGSGIEKALPLKEVCVMYRKQQMGARLKEEFFLRLAEERRFLDSCCLPVVSKGPISTQLSAAGHQVDCLFTQRLLGATH